jgi:PUA domain protein
MGHITRHCISFTNVKCRGSDFKSILANKSSPIVPELLPKVQVDRGAIKFVLSGANIMWYADFQSHRPRAAALNLTLLNSPGLTSAGGFLPDSLGVDQPVAVFAQGKEHPCAIGLSKMSAGDMRKSNKGIGVENVHYVGDDLWCTPRL